MTTETDDTLDYREWTFCNRVITDAAILRYVIDTKG